MLDAGWADTDPDTHADPGPDGYSHPDAYGQLVRALLVSSGGCVGRTSPGAAHASRGQAHAIAVNPPST